MYKLACVLLLAAGTLADVLDGTELLFTFIVHRHGDRTPVESSLAFSNNPEELAALSEPYGYGQLTDVGKRRSYELGKFIRDRYNELIAPEYNRSEIYIRSTDSTRTKMTILAALAAIYSPEKNILCEDLKWTPVPYTTVPVKYDFNTPFINCPVFSENYASLMPSSSAYKKKYGDVIKLMSKHVGSDLSQAPVLVYSAYDLFVSQLSLGLPVDPEIEEALPKVAAAAEAASEIVFGNEKYIALQAGVLLKEFYQTSSDIISGTDSRRVRIYSAHDINVISFKFVTKITNKLGVPKYGSAYSLELRRVVKTGKYVVVPVYLPSPGEDVVYLNVKGCGTVCDYRKFVDITSKYALDEDTWRSKCGWTKDLVIDDSSIA